MVKEPSLRPCGILPSGTGIGGPYEVCMEQLKQFRQAGSSTPGHPEFRMTSGVEVRGVEPT